MTLRDIAEHVIDILPKETNVDDIIQALYINTKFDHSERWIRKGRGISHEEAKQRLQKWVE